jgi:hypothetical protein
VADPTESDEQVWQLYAGLHRLFLRLAGRVPDEWLTHVRDMLGGGDLNYLPDTVAGSVLELGLTLRAAEAELLRSTLAALGFDGDEPAGLARVPISADGTPATNHRFRPAPPQVLLTNGARIPSTLDLTGGTSDELTDLPADLAHLDDLADDLTDSLDDRAMDNLARHDGTVAVWRAWRFGPEGPTERGTRVVLAEVDPGTPAWDLGYEAQRELKWKGEESPQVEVLWTGDELTPYHRAALAGAARLWVRP